MASIVSSESNSSKQINRLIFSLRKFFLEVVGNADSQFHLGENIPARGKDQ